MISGNRGFCTRNPAYVPDSGAASVAALNRSTAFVSVLCRRTPGRHRREAGRQIGKLDPAVGIAVFVHVHAGPLAGLRENSDVGVFRHTAVGLAAPCTAFLNDWCCPDREAALVENPLVSVFVDFSRSPRADARHPRVLQIGVDVEPLRASALRPEPTAINLVLKQMPLSAVIKIDGLFV